MQGFLYVASFALAYTAGGTLRILEGMNYTAKDEGRIYWLLVLDAFLKPLQGFLNLFVYCRPNYVRFRANYPELGRLWAIRKACLDPNIPRMPKGGSGESGWNTTVASRGAGNKELPDGVPLPKSMTRSMKVADHSSDLAVLKEESCEEDSSEGDSEEEDDAEEEATLAGNDRWGDATQDLASWTPIKSSHRNKSSLTSLKRSSLEVISELTVMSFVENMKDSQTSADDDDDDDGDSTIEPFQRWESGPSTGQQRLEKAMLLSLSKPELIAGSLAEVISPDESFDRMEAGASCSKSDGSYASADGPLRIPTRRLSPIPA
jgi:hypothetical protein